MAGTSSAAAGVSAETSGHATQVPLAGAARRTKQLAFAGRALAQSAGGQATQPAPAAVAAMLRNLDPTLRLARCWEMLGGVSAAVTGIEAERRDGERKLLVLRQYNSLDVAANLRIATTEYQLLASLCRCGVPAPRPLLADESGTIVPGPCLLAEFAQARRSPARRHRRASPGSSAPCSLASTARASRRATSPSSRTCATSPCGGWERPRPAPITS